MSFSPDGKRLVRGGVDRKLRVWDVERGQELYTLTHKGALPLRCVSFSADGTRLASVEVDTTVVWDEWGRELYTFKHKGAVFCVSFSPDGKRLASGGDDGTLRVWDAERGQELLTLRDHKGAVFYVSFSPDGKRLASGGDDGTVRVWEATADENP